MKAGWEIKKVSEIAQHSLGKMLDKSKNKGEPKPYLRNLNVRWFDFDMSDVQEMRFLPDETERYTARKGDVLVCEGGYPGRAAIWDQDTPIYFQKALHRVRFHEPERNRWFLYYLYAKDLDGTLRQNFNGAGIQHFTGETLAQFTVPLPPLQEQRRIVAILDEAFDGIATAKANAEKNLENARAVFESELDAFFSKLAAVSPDRKLADLCDFENGDRGKNYPSRSVRTNSGVPFINAGHLTDDGIDLESMDYIPRKRFDLLSNGKIQKGDILFCLRGSLGKFASVGHLAEGAIASSLVIVRPKLGNRELSQSYLELYFRSALCSDEINHFKNGAAQPNLSSRSLAAFRIPVPPLQVQTEGVERLTLLAQDVGELELICQRKLAALDELKKSLLHQAFAGRL